MKATINKINYKAVFLGMLTDIVTTTGIAIVYYSYVIYTYHNELYKIILEKKGPVVFMNFIESDKYFIVTLILSVFATIFGGYITARIAKKSIYLNLTVFAIFFSYTWSTYDTKS